MPSPCLRRAVNLETGEEIQDTFFDHHRVDTNCYLIDKVRCHDAIHGWAKVYPHLVKEGITHSDEMDFRQALRRSLIGRYDASDLCTVNYGIAVD